MYDLWYTSLCMRKTEKNEDSTIDAFTSLINDACIYLHLWT